MQLSLKLLTLFFIFFTIFSYFYTFIWHEMSYKSTYKRRLFALYEIEMELLFIAEIQLVREF